MQLRRDQEQHIKDLLDAQGEDQQVLQGLVQHARASGTTPAAAGAMRHAVLTKKMVLLDDPEAFLELYELLPLAWSWLMEQWVAYLLLLLSGETQLAADRQPDGVLGPEVGNCAASQPDPKQQHQKLPRNSATPARDDCWLRGAAWRR